ncbi:diguanylate cyclase (GGDEF) domain-containing protein [Sphingobium faniae]|nr:diguanylate cyclase (GGDEF) domain-containing protein [Sphingobium faniae]
MNPAVIVLSLLFFTSAIMAIAMGIAWVQFGHRRHVLSWTIAYSISVVQWALNGAGLFLGSPLLIGLTGLAIMASATFTFIGVRQRGERGVTWPGLLALGIPCAMAGQYAAFAQNAPLQGMAIPAYAGIMMLGSALSLWPRGRRFSAPELAFFALLLLFALFQLCLVASAGLNWGGPRQDMDAYRAILALGLPSIYVGTCVSAVLVVAGDLAYELRHRMQRDALTDVLNRLGLEEAATRAIANAKRHGRPLAFVICDLDGFKTLNDNHGHIAGDAALRGFARLVTIATRRGDIVGRLGGDEFGLLLVDTDAAAAADVMERIRVEFGCLSLPQAPGAKLRASFGIADLHEGDQCLDDMVARADSALYQAKKDGRDRVNIWRAAA